MSGSQANGTRGDNVSATDDLDFDSLIEDVLEHPEKLLKEDQLTADQVLAIQKRLNPYARIAGPALESDQKRVVVCSYTNLREDFIRRMTMTSLVGFIFQLLHEWEVPVEARRWVPAATKKKAADGNHQPFDIDKLVERMEATLAIAKEARAANAAYVKLHAKAAEDDACLPAKATAAEKQAVEATKQAAHSEQARAAGLLYATTHALQTTGNEAGRRLRNTAQAGMKFAEVKAVLDRFPLPAPPGQIEMPATAAKMIIDNFLRHWLEFDPSVHVRSGHDAKTIAAAVKEIRVNGTAVLIDEKDPGHLTIEAVRALAPRPEPAHREALNTILASKSAYNAVVALLQDPELVDPAMRAIREPETFRRYLLPVRADSPARPAADVIPPQDTFHRWAYYSEVNYEVLRTITEAIYPERPDLDWAIALWDVFEGTTKEVDDAFDEFCQQYQDEMPSTIKTLEFGSWSLLADFKKNREKVQFYNKNTEVLKRILDRHADDKRMGAELMRNRVRQQKARNIAETGPDAPGLKAYKRSVAESGRDLGSKGVERVIGQEEMRRLEKAQGSIKAAKELELLDEHEATIKRLTELQSLRELTDEEKGDLKHAETDIIKAREMVAVPDDAIQIDVFTSDPATGGFAKSHFYTKAAAPDHLDQKHWREPDADPASGPLPALAPYAVDHILAASKRTEADMKAEARRDADAVVAKKTQTHGPPARGPPASGNA